jgi:hypothetical protein
LIATATTIPTEYKCAIAASVGKKEQECNCAAPMMARACTTAEGFAEEPACNSAAALVEEEACIVVAAEAQSAAAAARFAGGVVLGEAVAGCTQVWLYSLGYLQGIEPSLKVPKRQKAGRIYLEFGRASKCPPVPPMILVNGLGLTWKSRSSTPKDL